MGKNKFHWMLLLRMLRSTPTKLKLVPLLWVKCILQATLTSEALSTPHGRMPPHPNLQFVQSSQQGRHFSMGVEPGNPSLTPARNLEPMMMDKTRGMRVEFPRFNGENPRGWLRKCHRYFILNPMTDVEKILLASMHFDGKAEYWYMDYIEGKEFMGWASFSGLLMERFLEGECQNLIGEFNKLQQVGTVEEYRAQFEELKSFMLHTYRFLNDEYFLKSFISGLKPELGDLVMVQRPITLSQAFNIAKLQESVLERSRMGQRYSTRKSYSAPQAQKAIKAPQEAARGGLIEYPGSITKRLTNEEVEDRKKRSICFNCDEKYTYGHNCKKVFQIEGFEDGALAELTDESNADTEEAPHISLTAIGGQLNPEAIKILGKVKNNTISILVDTGSTHSFLDPHTAKRL